MKVSPAPAGTESEVVYLDVNVVPFAAGQSLAETVREVAVADAVLGVVLALERLELTDEAEEVRDVLDVSGDALENESVHSSSDFRLLVQGWPGLQYSSRCGWTLVFCRYGHSYCCTNNCCHNEYNRQQAQAKSYLAHAEYCFTIF